MSVGTSRFNLTKLGKLWVGDSWGQGHAHLQTLQVPKEDYGRRSVDWWC